MKTSVSKAVAPVAFVLALAFTLLLHGAVPFWGTPTLGQAVWTTGFSHSFVNHGLLPYAYDFGAPAPASIAFGLAGAYPAALLIALGMHPADAYATMVALWLTVAFVSAWWLGIRAGAGSVKSTLAALAWVTMPVIWAHSGYSMLSTGIALLPFYSLAACMLFLDDVQGSGKIGRALLYLSSCLISVFMDGYSFMMFAMGSSIVAAYSFVMNHSTRRRLLTYSLPVHIAGFSLAYVLFALYIGKPSFGAAPLDFFRGWGADVTFFLFPTQGIHWMWDTLGLSVPRSHRELFGDSSVWKTTYLAPLLIAGLLGWLFTFSKSRIASAALIIAVAGLYLSLGPSLKFNSLVPQEIIETGVNMQHMPAELAIAPTGSALLSEHLPGFKNMRASYRWVALAAFGLWFLLLLWLSKAETLGARSAAAILCLAVIGSNLPHPQRYLEIPASNRAQFKAIDTMLVDDMREALQPGEQIAFLPYRNDFLVNYLAPSVPIRTYNIGGDKNLAMARENWPKTMRQFKMNKVDPAFADRLLWLLAQGEADAVVLPYIDMLWAAHAWPGGKIHQKQVQPAIDRLSATGLVDIDTREYYAVVRLNATARVLGQTALQAKLRQTLCLPGFCVRQAASSNAIHSRVGRLSANTLKSDGRRGFLVFGPYEPVESGTYLLVVWGRAPVPAGAWVDIVSSRGSTVHAKFSVPRTASRPDNILLEEKVVFDEAVDDLEVRIFAEEGSRIAITGYELRLARSGPDKD
ncbi:hypothetical protein [Nitratireductor rhodophyticola]